MRYLQHFNVLLCILSSLLIGCGRTLDAAKIEEDIRSNVVKQGGTSLKSVICPTNIQPATGASFDCTGVLEGGSGFTIAVKQQDDQGNVAWEVPSVKGLLNMAQLQTEFEQNLKKEVGQAAIDCGSPNPYRAVKPGETFECQLLKRNPTNQPTLKPLPQASPGSDSTKSTDAVQITVQPSGDVNWQRVIKTPAKVAASPTAPTKLPEPPKPGKPDSPEKPAPSPAAPSAEEFLKQPGAAEDFN